MVASHCPILFLLLSLSVSPSLPPLRVSPPSVAAEVVTLTAPLFF